MQHLHHMRTVSSCALLLQVVVSGGNIGEMAMHFLEKYGLMAVRIPSKFDLRRFCRATGSVALVKLQTPQADELGFAKQVTLPVRGFEGLGFGVQTPKTLIAACL